MNRHLSNVLDIKPQPFRRWTVLIQVVEHGHVLQSRAGHDYKRLILTDTQGTKLTAVIYSSHLRYFVNSLSPYKRYYISNAVVTKMEAKYVISSYPYSWTLNNRTLIEELVDPVPVTLPCQFNFTNFHDLHRYADTDTLHNVRAIVLRCFESVEQGSEITTRRELVIVNEEKKLMLLTLWNEFDFNEGHTLTAIIDTTPMIYAMRVKVTTFNCLSLTTRAASGIMINPPTAEGLQMREWYNNNNEELQQLMHKETFKNHNLLLSYPEDEEVVSIATITSSFNILKTAWVKGKVTLLRDDRSLWYSACANCQKSLDADLTWIVTCPSCKVESDVYPISRIPVTIDDGTGSIRAILYSPEAEKFIPLAPTDIQQAEEHGVDIHDTIATSIKEHIIVAFIRWQEVTFRGESETRIHVVTAYKSNDPSPAVEPPKDAKKSLPTSSTAAKKHPAHAPACEGPTKKAKDTKT